MTIFLIQDVYSDLIMLQRYVSKCYPQSSIYSFDDSFNAVQAINSFNGKIDICFASINSGRASGMEIAQQLRKNNAEAKLVIVEEDDRYAMDAWHLKARDYIIKPVTMENIQHTVSSCME